MPPPNFINLSLGISKDYQHLLHQISDLEDDPSDEHINQFIDEYSGKIKSFKGSLDLGFTLINHKTYWSSWKTQIQSHYSISGSGVIKQEAISVNDLLDSFPQALPTDFRNFVKTLSPGTDVISACLADDSLADTTKQLCKSYPLNTYKIPENSTPAPTLYYLYKEDFKIGFYNYYQTNHHWFGNFNLYFLRRKDNYQRISPAQIQNEDNFLGVKGSNQEDSLQLDYTLGYQNSTTTWLLQFQEIKLATLQTSSDPEAKPLSYQYHSLVKLQQTSHAQYSWGDLDWFTGLENRGYSLTEGIFAGVQPAWSIINPQSKLKFLVMGDSLFFTTGLTLDFYDFSIQYTLKNPWRNQVEDLIITPINTLNINYSF